MNRNFTRAGVALAVFSSLLLATPAFAAVNPSTDPATSITATDAMLNGTNGDTDAGGHSFWASLATFSTAVPSLPSGVYSTLDLGLVASSTSFSALLSSITGLLPITPSTTYYYAAWSMVGGNWYPGAIQTLTTPATTIYVDSAGNDSNDGSIGNPVKTIQHAIGISSAGGTIHVAAGTYNESINITKPLTIDGAGPDVTILDGNSATDNYYMVSIEADNVTVKDLAITNPLYTGTADASGITTANAGRKSNLHITNVKIHDIGTLSRAPASSGTYGINSGPVNGLEIDHSEIYNIGNGDVSGEADGILTWGNDDVDTADNINIHDNQVHDITAMPDSGYGIRLGYKTANAVVNHNTLTGPFNSGGIPTSPSMATGTSTISNNILTGASAVGILLRSPFAQTVTGNSISGATVGIQVNGTVTIAPTIKSNSISGNTTGFNNLFTSLVDATQNWWGSITGPNATTTSSVNTTGAGDSIVVVGGSDTSYRPWCLTSACSPIDTTVPTVSSVVVTPNPAKAGTATVTVTFNELMNNGISPVVTIIGLTGSPIAVTQTSFVGTTWVGTTTIAANNEDTIASTSVSGAEDLSGNQQVGTDTSGSFHVDTISPVVSSVSYNPTIGTMAIGDILTLTIHADAAGYTAGAITVNGKPVSGFTDNGDHTYTAYYTVASGDSDIANSAQIPVSVVLTDTAGNSNAAFTTAPAAGQTPAVDANAPVAPSTPDMTAGTDSGTSNTDNLTNVTTPTFTGTAEVGSTVRLYAGNTFIGSALAASGSWSVTSSALAQGTYSITGTATDAVGNTGATSSALSITIDTAVPVIAAHADVTNVQATSASGAVATYTAPNATDNVDSTAAASCTPASGSTFALGTTAVNCTKTDVAGNVAATTTFNVVVVDTTAPVIAAHATVTVEATSASGATVTYTSPATSDAVDGASTAICSAASGTTFAIGTTAVTCTKTDAHGNVATPTTFNVVVQDTTAPVIAAHTNITAEATSASGATVSYTSPATSDAVDGASTASCTLASGSTFALGTTTVTCSKTDAHGNAATPTTFSVIVVDTTAPVIASHVDVSAEATSAAGATVSYTSPATSDAVDGASTASCTLASGSTFAIGTTTVTCSKTDAHSNVATPTTFKVVVRDTTAPVIAAHADVTAEATSASGAVVSYTSPATTDAVDGASTASCTLASGSTFALGTTTVTCSKTDAHSNVATPTSFKVVVVDTTAPVIAAHADVIAEATSHAGAVVSYTSPTSTDAVDGAIAASCTLASGSTFALGTTTVTCSKTDAHSNVASSTSFNVVVVDTTAPVITVLGTNPDSVTTSNIAYTDAGATSTDNYDTSVTVSSSGAVGVTTPGTYVITYTATDSNGNTSTATRSVTVTGNASGGGGGGGGGMFTGNADFGHTNGNGGGGNGTGNGSGSQGQVLGASTFNFTFNFGFGSHGAHVTALQQVLIAGGFLKINAPTGTFGPATLAALKKYQAAHQIPATGFVGPLTRAALNAQV